MSQDRKKSQAKYWGNLQKLRYRNEPLLRNAPNSGNGRQRQSGVAIFVGREGGRPGSSQSIVLASSIRSVGERNE